MDTRQSTIFCTSCGHQMGADAKFCVNCGKQVFHPAHPAQQFDPAPLAYTGATTNLPLRDGEKQYAVLCHLSTLLGMIIPFGNFIAVLILWLTQKNTSDFVDDQGKEALNFQINILFWLVVFLVLSYACIGFPFLLLVFLLSIILPIIAAVQASEGKKYRYPAILRIIR